MGRLVDVDAVIKAVDRHTKDEPEIVLDNDITCILEEVPTAYEAPPFKIGDTAWTHRTYKGVTHAQEGVVSQMFYNKDMELVITIKHVSRGLLGKKVFLTKEDAEQALKKMENAR